MAWPDDRPVDYDEDKYFDITTETWVSEEVAVGGGRYQTQLVVIGQNDTGQGVVYYSG
jgi:hypothetical protein